MNSKPLNGPENADDTVNQRRLDGSKVVVVGGGFGGLSTACFLARAGAQVTLLEKNEQLGGRASRLDAEGFRFDMGPSWYLMPEVFERFFAYFGKHPSDYYRLDRLDPHYRMFFKDGDRVDMSGDREAMRALFERYEEGAGQQLDRYLERSQEIYEQSMPHFVYTDRPRLRDFMKLDVARHARGLPLLGTMAKHVAGYFTHPKLRQIVQYTLVFLGGAPRNTPALYSLMGHVDFNLGVYYPAGGIGALVDALEALARELGVEVRLNQEVEAIEKAGPASAVGVGVGAGAGAGKSLRVSVGQSKTVAAAAMETGSADATPTHAPAVETIEADFVVSNADYLHTERDLLAPGARQYSKGYWRRRVWAPSAYLLYLGVEGDVPELAHHSLVLPEDWEPHFDAIFDAPAWPDDPAYYLCVPSKTDDSVAPPGHSNLFVLVPLAAGLEDGPETRAAYRDRILEDIAKHTGEDLRGRIVFEKSFCVSDFRDRYHSAEGSALGLAHTLTQSAFTRPRRRSTKLPGLYFSGSYTTPGIGVPMCLIGGEHTARTILEDHGQPGGARATETQRGPEGAATAQGRGG